MVHIGSCLSPSHTSIETWKPCKYNFPGPRPFIAKRGYAHDHWPTEQYPLGMYKVLRKTVVMWYVSRCQLQIVLFRPS